MVLEAVQGFRQSVAGESPKCLELCVPMFTTDAFRKRPPIPPAPCPASEPAAPAPDERSETERRIAAELAALLGGADGQRNPATPPPIPQQIASEIIVPEKTVLLPPRVTAPAEATRFERPAGSALEARAALLDVPDTPDAEPLDFEAGADTPEDAGIAAVRPQPSQWLRKARRERWRKLARNTLAWSVTVLVGTCIVLLTAHALFGHSLDLARLITMSRTALF